MSAGTLVGRYPRYVSTSVGGETLSTVSTTARGGLPIHNARNLERISVCTFFTAQTDTLFTTQW